jgi:AhpD family alkylhydroperoxidase
MKLDYRIRELIAVGTAVGANCHSCLEYHVAKAREHGVADEAISASIEVGKQVRKGAQDKMDRLAAGLLTQAHGEPAAAACGCG